MAGQIHILKEQLKFTERTILNQRKAQNGVQQSKTEYSAALQHLHKNIKHFRNWVQDNIELGQNTNTSVKPLENGAILSLIQVIKRFDTSHCGVLALEEMNNLMVGDRSKEYDLSSLTTTSERNKHGRILHCRNLQ